MKAELVDESVTRKRLHIEIPGEDVEAAIDRATTRLGRTVKVPGFRPGKVPPRIVRQRFRDEILHEVTRELVPAAVDAALAERQLDPIATPEVRDIVIEDGRPMTFTAAFEVVPEAVSAPLSETASSRMESLPWTSARVSWARPSFFTESGSELRLTWGLRSFFPVAGSVTSTLRVSVTTTVNVLPVWAASAT
jgi:hypothetical protein